MAATLDDTRNNDAANSDDKTWNSNQWNTQPAEADEVADVHERGATSRELPRSRDMNECLKKGKNHSGEK